MNETNVRALVKQLALEVGFVVSDPPAGLIVPVHAGQSLQAVCDLAASGSTLVLDPGTWTEHLTLGAKTLTLRPTFSVPTGRTSPAFAPVVILGHGGGATIDIRGAGGSVALTGIAVQNTDPMATLINDRGQGTILDRVLAQGDPVLGQHRGVTAHGQGSRYTGCYIDDCGLVGAEGQAICGWDGTKDLIIADCYCGGAAQAIMFGGADATAADRMPTQIKILGCHLSKSTRWYQQGWMIKNGFELKAADTVTVQDCTIDYAGVNGGQAAYLIVLTPRNQDGTAPWSRVAHVLIERVRCQWGGGGVNMLGTDDTHPSGPLQDVTLRDVAFLGLDPNSSLWTQPGHPGSGRIVTIAGAAQQVTIENLTATAAAWVQLNSVLYVSPPAPVGLVVKNILTPATAYGYKIDGGGMGVAALRALCPDAQITVGTADTGAHGYPGA